MEISALFSFLIASVLLTFAPGPDIIFVLVKSLAAGTRAGISVACGLVTGTFFHTALAAFGISLLIRSSPAFFLGVKFLGAAYLVFLAIQAWRHRGENPGAAPSGESVPAEKTRRNPFFARYATGVFMAIFNPKLIIFFLAFFPQFLPENSENSSAQMLLLGTIFSAQALVIFVLVANFAGKLSRVLRERPAAVRALNIATAGTLLIVAGGVLLAA